jgi:hypothetical protein
MALLVITAVVAGTVVGWAIIAALARAASSQADHNPKAGDLHGSNVNFGNSLRGDNSHFSRCLYDE